MTSDDLYNDNLKDMYGTDNMEEVRSIQYGEQVSLAGLKLEKAETALSSGKTITEGQLQTILESFPDDYVVPVPPNILKRLFDILGGNNKGGPPTRLRPTLEEMFGDWKQQAYHLYYDLKQEGEKRIVALDIVAKKFNKSTGRIEQILAEENKKNKAQNQNKRTTPNA